ncbi:MAG: prepilin-type N-terminal cleavage/methylation domain-containing protein [Deltaproteobacteria bacterium]|nr:prepilin-type N-terminal cleavage/methylation domain-containing protein [Deltaproteobacteria bacterium]
MATRITTKKGSPRNTSGFTLIELILAMVILSILGTYTWISMDTAFKTQKAVERFADLYEQASAVTGKVTMDVSQMFLIPSSQNLTYLKGDEGNIAFTSLSHVPLTSMAKESEQTEIIYQTVANENRRGLKLLQRSETRFIDGLKEKKEEEKFEILTGQLESIVFEYSKDGVDYVKSWDTTERDNKDKLPKIIKLQLTFKEGDPTGQPDEEREVFLESYIDIPMSEFYSPVQQTKQDGKGKKGENTNNQNNQNNQNPQQPSNNINPMGVDG